MNALKSFSDKHPVWAALLLAIFGFLLILVFSGIASGISGKGFGDSAVIFYGHLATGVCIFILIWKMGWLKSAGIAKIGTCRIWLIALAGVFYFALASLYAYYGSISLDFSNLTKGSDPGSILLTNLAVCLNEEMLFRGAVLYILLRIPGITKNGRTGSVLIMSVIFAALHLPQIFVTNVSAITALFFFFETVIISFWWGSIVWKGASIWPAFLLHFTGNVVVAIQGLSSSMIEPATTVYRSLLLFSIPLGIISLWLLLKSSKSATKNHGSKSGQ